MNHRRSHLMLLVMVASIVALAGCGKSTDSTSPVTPLDGTPPPAPDGISLITSTDANALTWSPSSAPDVAMYQVYQYSPDPSRDSAYLLIGSTSASSLTLPRMNDAQDSYYKVRAVDQAGNSSAYSAATLMHVPAIGSGEGGGTGQGQDGGGLKKIGE